MSEGGAVRDMSSGGVGRALPQRFIVIEGPIGVGKTSLARRLAQATAAIDDACLLVCMIESAEGLANLEAICAQPGIDVIHFGTNDFAANIGKPGRFDDPEVREAQLAVIDTARRHGKFAGCGGNRSVERQAASITGGAQFVTTQTDIGFLMAAASQWVEGVKGAIRQ